VLRGDVVVLETVKGGGHVLRAVLRRSELTGGEHEVGLANGAGRRVIVARLRLLTALHRVAPSFQLLTEHLVSAGLRLCLRILVAKHRLLSR